jgi:hypothetical protein
MRAAGHLDQASAGHLAARSVLAEELRPGWTSPSRHDFPGVSSGSVRPGANEHVATWRCIAAGFMPVDGSVGSVLLSVMILATDLLGRLLMMVYCKDGSWQ